MVARGTSRVGRRRWVCSGVSPFMSAISSFVADLAEALHRLTHRRQRRDVARGFGDVVEADHRELVGHRDAQLGGDGEHRDRRQVVRGEDGGRAILRARAGRARAPATASSW